MAGPPAIGGFQPPCRCLRASASGREKPNRTSYPDAPCASPTNRWVNDSTVPAVFALLGTKYQLTNSLWLTLPAAMAVTAATEHFTAILAEYLAWQEGLAATP